MLNVNDIGKSLEFYQKALGFELVSPVEDLTHFHWGIVANGGTELMLSESQPQKARLQEKVDPLNSSDWRVNFYFYPPDINALHVHLLDNNFEPTALIETEYGMLEFSLQDPDGHLLSFGSN